MCKLIVKEHKNNFCKLLQSEGKFISILVFFFNFFLDTVIIRLLLTPMYVKSRQASVKTSNHHEVTSALYEKIRRATLKGDDLTGENVFCKVWLNVYNIQSLLHH